MSVGMRLSLATNKYSFHITADSLFHCCSSIFRSEDYVSESPSGARTGVMDPSYRTIAEGQFISPQAGIPLINGWLFGEHIIKEGVYAYTG